MEWPVNALFVLLGALLTWITPHGVKLRWARVVAVCLGLRVRLEPTPEARLHKRILYWSGRLIFGVASNLLYPRVFITSERICTSVRRDRNRRRTFAIGHSQ